ncbi:MAG: hypothetical protein MAG451_02553 [Anaerolineales bacterium]|nr:hypothetical protein [Anaerolineales bacterium]
MRIIAWITAVFGALVMGVAIASLLDELLDRPEKLQLDGWSQKAIARVAITIVVVVVSMAVWMWLWLRYVV